MPKPKGLFILGASKYDAIYGPDQRREIEELADIYAPAQTPDSVKKNPSVLANCEVVFTGWEGPYMDKEFLDAAPNLKAVFYGAGTVRGIVTDEFWKRNIILTSAFAANAIPVAEFCVAQILFSLKCGWYYLLETKRIRAWPERVYMPGAFRSTVGLVSLGMIAKKTLELLRPYDLDIMVYSTSLSDESAREMGVRKGSLEEIFTQCDVVSLHTPDLPATQGMITGAHFEKMKENATFINTARGRVVREDEMVEVLKKRRDIHVCLDVTYPEPPEQGSPLYDLPNVIMTPHVAGSMCNECHRMAQFVVEELRLYLAGKPQKWRVTEESLKRMA